MSLGTKENIILGRKSSIKEREVLIQAKIREQAIAALQAEGKLDSKENLILEAVPVILNKKS